MGSVVSVQSRTQRIQQGMALWLYQTRALLHPSRTKFPTVSSYPLAFCGNHNARVKCTSTRPRVSALIAYMMLFHFSSKPIICGIDERQSFRDHDVEENELCKPLSRKGKIYVALPSHSSYELAFLRKKRPILFSDTNNIAQKEKSKRAELDPKQAQKGCTPLMP